MFREFSKETKVSKKTDNSVVPEPVPDHFEDEEPHVGRNKVYTEVRRQVDIKNKTYLEKNRVQRNFLSILHIYLNIYLGAKR